MDGVNIKRRALNLVQCPFYHGLNTYSVFMRSGFYFTSIPLFSNVTFNTLA